MRGNGMNCLVFALRIEEFLIATRDLFTGSARGNQKQKMAVVEFKTCRQICWKLSRA